MRYNKALVMALVALMSTVSFSWFVSAAEETVVIPITAPGVQTPDGGAVDCYAVYFADNMAFTPQWRVGNLVRIEVMVLKVWDYNGDGLIQAADIPVVVNTNITSGAVGDQASYIANPNDLMWTWMVSVPQIWVDIVGPGGALASFYSDFSDLSADPSDTVGREINKAGHLIYGFLWDTTGMPTGVYTVNVRIPSAYNVQMAVRSLVVSEEADPIGYEPVPSDNDMPGTGGVVIATNTAFINLGTLIAKGGSSGGGGGGGGGSGGGSQGGGGYHGRH